MNDIARFERALMTVRKELKHMSKAAVYFAQCDRNAEVKIGFSTCVPNRLYALSNQRWSSMTLLGWVRGGPKVEREMHARFAEFAIGHEWFLPAPELLEFAKTSIRHDEPKDITSKYGRINDMRYDSLVRYESHYLRRIEEAKAVAA